MNERYKYIMIKHNFNITGRIDYENQIVHRRDTEINSDLPKLHHVKLAFHSLV